MRPRATIDATERELAVVEAVLATGSEKAAAHRLGLWHSTVKHHLANARSKVGAETTRSSSGSLGPRLPEAYGAAAKDDWRWLELSSPSPTGVNARRPVTGSMDS